MIIIQNISREYSLTDWQEYEVRINRKPICRFKHKASDGLSRCLEEASNAVLNHDNYTANTQESGGK